MTYYSISSQAWKVFVLIEGEKKLFHCVYSFQNVDVKYKIFKN
jgi:serine protease inhibitor ecotin